MNAGGLDAVASVACSYQVGWFIATTQGNRGDVIYCVCIISTVSAPMPIPFKDGEPELPPLLRVEVLSSHARGLP